MAKRAKVLRTVPAKSTTLERPQLSSFSSEEIRQRMNNDQSLLQAQYLYLKGKVALHTISQEMVTATVQGEKSSRVSFISKLAGQCHCRAWQFSRARFCKHMAAVAIALFAQEHPTQPVSILDENFDRLLGFVARLSEKQQRAIAVDVICKSHGGWEGRTPEYAKRQIDRLSESQVVEELLSLALFQPKVKKELFQWIAAEQGQIQKAVEAFEAIPSMPSAPLQPSPQRLSIEWHLDLAHEVLRVTEQPTGKTREHRLKLWPAVDDE